MIALIPRALGHGMGMVLIRWVALSPQVVRARADPLELLAASKIFPNHRRPPALANNSLCFPDTRWPQVCELYMCLLSVLTVLIPRRRSRMVHYWDRLLQFQTEDDQRPDFLSQRTQRLRFLQQAIMSACQLALCHDTIRPSDWNSIPLHQSH